MTLAAPALDPIPRIVDTSCRHHWTLQPAVGPLSTGVCLNCGATKEFKNFVDSSGWSDERLEENPGAEITRILARAGEEDEEE